MSERKETNKLFRVTLKGFHGSPWHEPMVVAKDPTEAYEKIRTRLDEEDYGLSAHRELVSVTLLAEERHYTEAPSVLLL